MRSILVVLAVVLGLATAADAGPSPVDARQADESAAIAARVRAADSHRLELMRSFRQALYAAVVDDRRATLAASRLAPSPRPAPAGVDAALWRFAGCESGRNPRAVSSTGKFRGAWQFDQTTWDRWRDHATTPADPVNASLDQQLVVARAVYAGQGPGAWPVCSHR